MNSTSLLQNSRAALAKQRPPSHDRPFSHVMESGASSPPGFQGVVQKAPTYSVTQAKNHLPGLLKNVAKEGAVAITRHDETVAYLISRKRMEAVAETLDILGNPDAMRIIRKYERGACRFVPLNGGVMA